MLVTTDGSQGPTAKSGALRFLHATQSYIVDANQVWLGQTVNRFNKSILRWPAPWRSKEISFNAQATPRTTSGTDGSISIMVDGALFTFVAPPADALNRRYRITNLPIAAGGSIVEAWEPENARTSTGSSLDTGADAPMEGGMITGIWLPPGMHVAPARATTGIITVGDSIISATNQAPENYLTVVGQLRLLAQAKDWLVGSLDYGSATLRGDGFTPAQLAANITSLAAQMGLSTVYVYFQIGRNDYNYCGLPGSINSNPTQVATFLQTVIAALPASYRVVVCTPITQSTVHEAANSLGFTLQQYRDAIAAVTGSNIVAHLDGTTFGIVPASDLYDGVHELAPPLGNGVPKNLAGMRAAVGLP